MVIGRVSGSMETMATAVNPHKEAVDLAEQQMDELADDPVRDNYETTMKSDQPFMTLPGPASLSIISGTAILPEETPK